MVCLENIIYNSVAEIHFPPYIKMSSTTDTFHIDKSFHLAGSTDEDQDNQVKKFTTKK